MFQLNNCLIRQIYYMTSSQYLEFLEKPVHKKSLPSLFGHPILDQCSMTPWYVPGFYLILVAMTFSTLFPFIFGILFWTLYEYICHRFIFHMDIKSYSHLPVARILHFVLHGMHHVYPDDPLRLVLPPLFTLPFTYLFYIAVPHSIFSGILFGYILYDMCHYWFHHLKDGNFWPFSTTLWKELRRNHMTHHYSTPNKRFGVSSLLWDKVFST